MTGTATRVRYWKTNPECRGDRHRPEHKSFTSGCTCPETLAAEERHRATYQRTRRGTAKVAPAGDDVHCKAELHTPTNQSWRAGCRHPGAIAAHDRWKTARAAVRESALARWRLTGECAAANHDTRYAYSEHGCRCDLAVKLDRAWKARKPKVQRVRNEKMQTVQLMVGHSSLMMLLAGVPDRPTMGEIMAADIRLQRVRVPNGPSRWRSLTVIEIAGRLGVADRTINRMRKERLRLRSDRHLRRLAEVRAKAERVQRAVQRLG